MEGFAALIRSSASILQHDDVKLSLEESAGGPWLRVEYSAPLPASPVLPPCVDDCSLLPPSSDPAPYIVSIVWDGMLGAPTLYLHSVDHSSDPAHLRSVIDAHSALLAPSPAADGASSPNPFVLSLESHPRCGEPVLCLHGCDGTHWLRALQDTRDVEGGVWEDPHSWLLWLSLVAPLVGLRLRPPVRP
jgi:Autophagocytosis associated protein, active-site domain